MKTIKVHDHVFTFDPAKDNLLKRGLIDPYLQGKVGEWVVLEEYIYWSARLQEIVIVPRWMKTDLASIPKLARWLISVNDRHIFAALLHDFGYATARTTKYSREEWDGVLLDFCKHFKVSWWKRSAMHAAVRVGGFVAWNNNKNVSDSYMSIFIDGDHRYFYKKVHSSLSLPIESGDYFKV